MVVVDVQGGRWIEGRLLRTRQRGLLSVVMISTALVRNCMPSSSVVKQCMSNNFELLS